METVKLYESNINGRARNMEKNDLKTAIHNLTELFKMIEHKQSDSYICAMKQYVVNPLAYLHTKSIMEVALEKEAETKSHNRQSAPCCHIHTVSGGLGKPAICDDCGEEL